MTLAFRFILLHHNPNFFLIQAHNTYPNTLINRSYFKRIFRNDIRNRSFVDKYVTDFF